MPFKHAPVFIVLLALSAHAQSSPPLDVLLERLDAYFQSYEKQLTSVTADEIYVQEEERVGWVAGDTARRRLSRTVRRLESEMAFVRLPGDADWLGFRDVRTVDGKSVVTDKFRLGELLDRGGNVLEQAASFTEASARYNLGIYRTINMPTIPLEVLAPRHRSRFSYELGGRDSIRGRRTVRIDFAEIRSPTVVRHPEGGEVTSSGTAWLEPQSGTLWRASVAWRGGNPQARARRPASTLTVEFDLEPRLQTMVPVEMRESFRAPDGGVEGKATYRNFRRFETGARIVPMNRH